jgi:hypothetical protein
MSNPIYQVTINFKGETVGLNDNGFWQSSYDVTGEFPPGKTKDRLVAKLKLLAEQVVPGQNLAENQPYVRPCHAAFLEIASQISRHEFDDTENGKRAIFSNRSRNFDLTVETVYVGSET